MTAQSASLRNVLTALHPLGSFAARMLVTLLVCRTVFVIYQWPQIVTTGDLTGIYTEGMRFDIALLSLILAVPIAAFPLFTSVRRLVPAWRGLLSICLPVVLLIVILIECATPSFVDQLDTRPALIFLDYLNQPVSVAQGLWAEFHTPILACALFALLATWLHARRLAVLTRRVQPVSALPAIAVMILLLGTCVTTVSLIAEQVAADAGGRNPVDAGLLAYNTGTASRQDQSR